MKILVFMSDNRDLDTDVDKYHSLAECINSAYCKTLGYDFLYFQPYLDNNYPIELLNCIDPNTRGKRHASWSKLLSTEKALDLGYDYVVYIDSDCIFKDFHTSIEHFIISNLDSNIIFFNNKPWGDDKPCAGFYICKVANLTKDLIRKWYNVNIPEKNNCHAWEQDALWNISSENIAVLDTWMFKEVNGQYLRHIPNWSNRERAPYFKEFIAMKGLNIEENVNINQIRFNTSISNEV